MQYPTYPSENFIFYSSIAADTPLTYLDSNGQGTSTSQKSRQIICFGAGNLVVTNSLGSSITIPVTAGYRLDICTSTIKSTTTATNILILF